MKKFHFINKDFLTYSENNILYLDNDKKELLTFYGILPDAFFLLKRLLRNGVHAAKMCQDTLIVILKGKFVLFKNNRLVKEIDIDRGSRPLRNGVECISGRMYYGDYWSNSERQAVNIYKVDLKTFKKEKFYTFSHVRHIHFIQQDRINKDILLIGTGDSDSESGIYSLNVKTKEFAPIVEGSQKFRAVSILQNNNSLFWGSDDPDSENYIYQLNRDTQELRQICKIDGPAYYSTRNKKGEMFIATTIEDRKRHKAIIYKSNDGGQSWSVYKKFKKDLWHDKYFGHGIIEFIDGQENYDELIYNTVGLKEIK
jgi:hypothetical protein